VRSKTRWWRRDLWPQSPTNRTSAPAQISSHPLLQHRRPLPFMRALLAVLVTSQMTGSVLNAERRFRFQMRERLRALG